MYWNSAVILKWIHGFIWAFNFKLSKFLWDLSGIWEEHQSQICCCCFLNCLISLWPIRVLEIINITWFLCLYFYIFYQNILIYCNSGVFPRCPLMLLNREDFFVSLWTHFSIAESNTENSLWLAWSHCNMTCICLASGSDQRPTQDPCWVKPSKKIQSFKFNSYAFITYT